jgi:filamentous hemagglutinin family protein
MNKLQSQSKLRMLMWGCASLVGLLADSSAIALAQVIPDRSLPQNSVVETNGDTFNITGGSLSGTNLFHSFNEFSIDANQTAHFQNDAAIANILSRVTGNNVSNIDGLIRTNGSANLFLVNPNGIVFGENARLDIGGSFVATSADAIEFAGGELFPAQDTGVQPLLTMTTPVGLQFNAGNEHGTITVQGQGHTLTREDPTFTPIIGLGMLEHGLQVLPGQNLALIGNGVDLNGGLISATGANLELASLSTGKVSFTPTEQGWQFSYAPIAAELSFSDLNLSDRALIDGSGMITSRINLNANNLNIKDGSLVVIQNQGVRAGHDIRVNATGDVVISGTTADTTIQSGIDNTTLTPGPAGAIVVNAENLSVLEGAILLSRTYTNGRGGDLNLNINSDLRITGFSPRNPLLFSTIGSITLSEGRSGDIYVNTRNLIAKDTGLISTVTFGSGEGGNLEVVATELIELAGASPLTTTPASIAATTFNSGNAGDVNVTTKNLVIEQGGRIDSSTLAFGDAGSVTVNASESVILSGDPTQPGEPGLIASASAIVDPVVQEALLLPPLPTGNSGDITINTGLLQATNGGLVSVVSNGPGNPGAVNITSDRVVLRNRGGILALTDQDSGGSINIDANNLEVFAAFINASAIGTGDAGGININVTDTITVSEVAFLPVFNALFVPFIFGNPGDVNIEELNGILSIAASEGNAGRININARELIVRDGGLITSTILGDGAAGNINFVASESLQLDGGLVVAASAINQGKGGNLEIISPVIKLTNGGLISSVTLGGGDAGTLVVRAAESLEIADSFTTGNPVPGLDLIVSSISSTSTATATGDGGNLIVITPRLSVSNGGVVAASADGLGNAGNMLVQSDVVTIDNGNINAGSFSGQGGNIDMQIADSLILRNQSNIIATAGSDQSSSGNGGNINISVPVLVLLEGSAIDANAFLGNGGNIDIVTSGLFNSSNSTISASSQLGVDGVVEVNSPDIDPSSGLVELETSVVDFTNLIAVGCDADRGNTFIATGRSGLPASPREIVKAEPSVIDWRSPFSTNTANQPANQSQSPVALNSDVTPETNQNQEAQKLKTITEVRGWRLDQDGEIMLLAEVANPELPPQQLTPDPHCLSKQ